MKRWLISTAKTVALLAGISVSANGLASVSADALKWHQLVMTTANRSDEELFHSIKYGGSATKGRLFFKAEAECSANSAAILNINDLLKSAPTELRVGSEAGWSGKTVVYLRMDYADSHHYRFICLVGSDDKLERTRLLDDSNLDNSSAVEIDGSNYIYHGD